MQRDDAGPIGPRRENSLVPELRLRARIREHNGALAFLDGRDDLRHHLRPEVARPREALDHRRDERVDHDVFRVHAADDACLGRGGDAEQRARRVVEVADGTYGNQTINFDSTKTSTSDVVFRPAAGAAPSFGFAELYSGHITVEGLTFRTLFQDKISINVSTPTSVHPYFIGRYYDEQVAECGRYFSFIFAPERMQKGYIPSLREYNRVFGVSRERLSRAPKDVLILHPGPMNRGVEIDSNVADDARSVIREQVEMGVAVRMAVLQALARHLPNR